MSNPRFVSLEGNPTVELLKKLDEAQLVYYGNLEFFCNRWGYNIREMLDIKRIYLVGSHATEDDWKDETSDVDLKILNSTAFPEALHRYKREVLDPILCRGSEKRRWIDLFFANQDHQITPPRFDLTRYWLDLMNSKNH